MISAAIKKELNTLGIQFVDIARELGVSKTSVSLVVNGKSVSDRVQKAIAAKLNKEPEEVFPEYYEKRLRKVTKPNAVQNASENEREEEKDRQP